MLIDNLMNGMPQCSDYGIELVQRLLTAVRFQIDNVARYVFENTSTDGKEFNINKLIPNMAPLAPVVWLEYNGMAAGKDIAEQYGLLVTVTYDSASSDEVDPRLQFKMSEENVRWVLAIESFTQNRVLHPNVVDAYDWVYLIALDKNGQFLFWSARPNHITYPDMPGDPPELLDRGDYFYIGVVVALTSICFAHCKGAEVKEHQPSRQVRRHAERKGEPVYSYRTIDIGPASRVLSGEGNIKQNGLGKALHICRGHFAHYTADKPLFGKYVGTVYKPMHIRGKAENGAVEKDYRIHAEV